MDEDFEKLADQQGNQSLVAEFLQFLRHGQKWWLLPIICALLLVGAIILVGGSAGGPFLYTLF